MLARAWMFLRTRIASCHAAERLYFAISNEREIIMQVYNLIVLLLPPLKPQFEGMLVAEQYVTHLP
jgi:hypothetical protein